MKSVNPTSQSEQIILIATGKRDMSRRRMSAALRKQRQRQRQRQAGVGKVEVMLTKEVADLLAKTGEILGTSTKAEAERLLKRVAAANLKEVETLAKRAGSLWVRAVPYLPYISYLQTPGAQLRIKDRVLTQAEWAPLQTELSGIYASLGRMGWGKPRIEAFFRRSAKRYGVVQGPVNPTTQQVVRPRPTPPPISPHAASQ